jgi:hypothetical protein
MNPRDQLYSKLPETFTPADARELAEQLNDKYWLQGNEWIRTVLDGWLFDKKVERISRGLYRKLETQEAEA